jgi:hypothetical protein
LLSTYPWVNHKSEAEIERALGPGDQAEASIENGKEDI